MKTILNKLCVLELNKNWFPITLKTPKQVFETMSKGNIIGLRMEYSDEDVAEEDFSRPTDLTPVKWEDWINLPVRDFDLTVRTSSREIRIPSIVICANYSKIPHKDPKFSKKNIMLRDNMTCQYSGNKYDKKELNIDHVVPSSKGGQLSWENAVTCHKSINSKKGDKTVREAGLTLIRKPRKPTISEIFFADKTADPKWEMFMNKLN